MTKSSLRERFERLGRIQPAIVSLRLLGKLDRIKSVEAVIASRRRGAPTLEAKWAFEAAMERKPHVLEIPTVESTQPPGRTSGRLERSRGGRRLRRGTVEIGSCKASG